MLIIACVIRLREGRKLHEGGGRGEGQDKISEASLEEVSKIDEETGGQAALFFSIVSTQCHVGFTLSFVDFGDFSSTIVGYTSESLTS